MKDLKVEMVDVEPKEVQEEFAKMRCLYHKMNEGYAKGDNDIAKVYEERLRERILKWNAKLIERRDKYNENVEDFFVQEI